MTDAVTEARDRALQTTVGLLDTTTASAHASDAAARETLAGVLASVRDFEAQFLNAHSYKSPYYFWHWNIAADVKARLINFVTSALAGDRLDAFDRLDMLVLGRRVSTDMPIDLSKMVDLLNATATGECHVETVRDVAALAHLEKDFEALQTISHLGLGRAEAGSDHARAFADYLFQVRYQGLKVHIFERSLTDENIADLRDLRSKLAAHIGTNSRNVAIYDSIVACMNGDVLAAEKLAAEAGDRSGKTTPYFLAARNALPPAEISAFKQAGPEGAAAALAAFPVQHIRNQPAETALLISCDEGYFDDFALNFVRSFAHSNTETNICANTGSNTGACVHFHCVGFTPDHGRLDQWQADTGVMINASVDTTQLKGIGTNDQDIRMGYYAGARYIHLPYYLTIYDRIVITDIDGVFDNSIDAIFADSPAIQMSSVLLDPAYSRYFAMWENIGAGAFACTAAPEHKAFAATLSLYLQTRFHQAKTGETRFFYSDQVGLLQSYLQHRGDTDFVRMSPTFEQSGSLADSTRKGDKKAFQRAFLDGHDGLDSTVSPSG